MGRYSNFSGTMLNTEGLRLDRDLSSTVAGNCVSLPKLSGADLASIRSDYEAGVKIEDISLKHGVGRSTVRTYITRMNLTLRLPKIKETDYEAIAEARDRGLTQEQIGVELGISESTVYRSLRKVRNQHR